MCPGCLLAWDDGRSRMAEYAREPDGDGFARSGEELAGITEWLGGAQAAGLDHAELEEQIAARTREVARLLLQALLDLRAERERRRGEVTGPGEAHAPPSAPTAARYAAFAASRPGWPSGRWAMGAFPLK